MKRENDRFLKWYNGLRRYEQLYFKQCLAKACDVSRATIYLWVKGETRIKRPYQRIINGLAGQTLFDCEAEKSNLQMNCHAEANQGLYR